MNKFEKISAFQFLLDFEGLDLGLDADYDEIKLPKRATKNSAGYDIFNPFNHDIVLQAGETIKFPTGIRVLLDDDKVLLITPRSGLGFKYRLQLDNTIGVIDADYSSSGNEGHIWVKITNDSKEGKTVIIPKGSAVCQGIIVKFYTTEDDNTDGVRNGGFGSTDK